MVKGILITTVLLSLVPRGGEVPTVTYTVISTHPKMKVTTPLFSMPETRPGGNADKLLPIVSPERHQPSERGMRAR